jgi:ribose transport system substrate-binding protein
MKHIPKFVRRSVPAVIVVAVLATAGCTATSTGTGSGSSGSAQDLSKFKSVVDEASKPWTKWEGPDSTPAPPKNISLALVTCAGAVAGCVLPAEGAAAAAKALGWTTTMYDGKGDPVTQNNVVTQAINSGANAVLMAGVDPAQIGSALALAKSKNIPVGSMTQGIEPGNGIAFDIGADYVQSGVIMGSWIVADSAGKAVLLPTNDKEFASTLAIVNSAIATVKECSDCKVKTTEFFVGSNIGNGLGQRIASALQRQPDVNYLIGAFDPAVGDMVPAITNAGLADRVKIISDVGLTQNLEFIKNGNVQAADVVYDNTYTGYAAVDQMIRILNGKELWKNASAKNPAAAYNENAPQHLTTKENVGDPSKPWTADNDAVSHYEKLWALK